MAAKWPWFVTAGACALMLIWFLGGAAAPTKSKDPGDVTLRDIQDANKQILEQVQKSLEENRQAVEALRKDQESLMLLDQKDKIALLEQAISEIRTNNSKLRMAVLTPAIRCGLAGDPGDVFCTPGQEVHASLGTFGKRVLVVQSAFIDNVAAVPTVQKVMPTWEGNKVSLQVIVNATTQVRLGVFVWYYED